MADVLEGTTEPVMRNIESFLKDTQRYVSGDVRVRMRPYCFELLGARSDHDLMDATFACYGEENKAWTAEEVKGFTRMLSMPLRVYHAVNEKSEEGL